MKSFKELKKFTKEGAKKHGMAVSRFDGFIVCIRDDDSQDVKEFVVDRESFLRLVVEELRDEEEIRLLEQSGCCNCYYDYKN